MNNNRLTTVLLLAGALVATSPVSAQKTAKKAPEIDVLCIQEAIDERDTTLATVVVSWSSATGQALEQRRDALKESWNIPEYKARRLVQRKTWSDYGKTLRAANNTKVKERRDAWKKFDHDRKECEGAYSPEMKTGSTYDANL